MIISLKLQVTGLGKNMEELDVAIVVESDIEIDLRMDEL